MRVLKIKIGHPFGAMVLVVLSNVLYVDVLDICKIIRMKCPYLKKQLRMIWNLCFRHSSSRFESQICILPIVNRNNIFVIGPRRSFSYFYHQYNKALHVQNYDWSRGKLGTIFFERKLRKPDIAIVNYHFFLGLRTFHPILFHHAKDRLLG